MAISLRRSRRSTKKCVSEFNVGDIVEIDRQHGTIAKGRLAQLLTEGPSPNPRWLVKFDSQPYKDEEMYERSFKTLNYSNNSNEDKVSSSTAPALINDASASISADDDTGSARGNRIISNEEENNNNVTKRRGKNSQGFLSTATTSKTTKTINKSVQFHRDDGTSTGSNECSEDSSPNEENLNGKDGQYRISQREARSRRRQAKIDDAAVETEVLPGKRRFTQFPGKFKRFKSNEQQYAEDGEMVKVTLKTGILYIYRGTHRRVEFVRRV